MLKLHSISKTPMKITLLMNCVSIFAGYLFIFGNFGLPNLGVQGAPIGMILGYFVSASIGLYILFNKKKGVVYFEEHDEEKNQFLKI
jgi:Na+-driven multidrug efflux pump